MCVSPGPSPGYLSYCLLTTAPPGPDDRSAIDHRARENRSGVWDHCLPGLCQGDTLPGVSLAQGVAGSGTGELGADMGHSSAQTVALLYLLPPAIASTAPALLLADITHQSCPNPARMKNPHGSLLEARQPQSLDSELQASIRPRQGDGRRICPGPQPPTL